MSIQLKRAYEKPDREDGYRVLVDGLWPRGVSKADLKIDRWLKEIAPSPELRKWFNHDPAKWDEFKQRYFQELNTNREALDLLREKAGQGPVTLVFAAKNKEHNNAVALKEYLEGKG